MRGGGGVGRAVEQEGRRMKAGTAGRILQLQHASMGAYIFICVPR